MALAYRPPSVNVEEVISPTVSPLLASPANVCLVGPSQGYQTKTDQFVLTGTSAIALPTLPAGATASSVVSVKDALDPSKGATNGSGYVVTTDYTVNLPNGTISRVGAGGIADGTLVNVTYQYIPSDYFEPIRLFDFASIESRFGPALNAAGTGINSPVTYAAGIAFENGAGSVVIQPLFTRATPGDSTTAKSQPNSTQTAASVTWSDTLFSLRDIEDVNLIVPIIGQSTANVTDAAQLSIFQTIQDHIQFMATQQQYVFALLGEDSSGSNSVAQKATIRAHASTLQSRYGGAISESMQLFNTSKFTRPLPGYGATLFVGAQYIAAGVAGMIAARPVSSTTTREVVAGFLAVNDVRTLQDKNADAAAGLTVLEQKGTVVRIRHSVTLDNTATQRREVSVVRAKHRMIESVRDTLESQIIGKIIADQNAPYIVRSAVVGVLEGLRQVKDLVEYSSVEARLKSLDPTTIQVRFSYRPAFPLNYVDITFSLDLTSQTITADTGAASTF